MSHLPFISCFVKVVMTAIIDKRPFSNPKSFAITGEYSVILKAHENMIDGVISSTIALRD